MLLVAAVMFTVQGLPTTHSDSESVATPTSLAHVPRALHALHGLWNRGVDGFKFIYTDGIDPPTNIGQVPASVICKSSK